VAEREGKSEDSWRRGLNTRKEKRRETK